MTKPKIALFGWDSATFDVILPLLQEGALPNLAQRMSHGVWGDLQSTTHPLSPTAWASFMTGMNPGKHGIYDFVGLDENGDFKLSNGGHLKEQTLWSRLSQSGQSVAVVNVPMTYPPANVNGFLIAGMDTPPHVKKFTHPPSLAGEIDARFGPYVIDVHAKGLPWQSVNQFTKAYVRRLCENVHRQGEVVRYLAEQNDLDFLMLVFTATDRVQHALGHLLSGTITPDDGIGLVYQACDMAMGKVMEALDDEWSVVIMSDHGACAYSRIFEPNTWLATQGYLSMLPTQETSRINEALGALQRRIARRLGRAPDQQPRLAGFQNQIRWDQTRAFALGAFGSIYINSTDRFPHGIVEPGSAYNAVCTEISEGLLSLRDPETGRPIVRTVWRSTDVYSGDCAHLAPDLLLDTYDEFFIRNNLDHHEGHMVADAGRYGRRSLAHTGRHTSTGILVMEGTPFLRTGQHVRAAIIDLAPTILHLRGLPVPQAMDGRPLTDWLEPDFQSKHPVKQGDDRAGTEPNQEMDAYTEHDAGNCRGATA